MTPLPYSNTGLFLPYILVFLQASTWGRCIHSLFLYSDMPFAILPPDWTRLLFSQTFTCINTLAILSQSFLLFTQPTKMEQSVPQSWHIKFRRWANHDLFLPQFSPFTSHTALHNLCNPT